MEATSSGGTTNMFPRGKLVILTARTGRKCQSPKESVVAKFAFLREHPLC